MRKTKAVALALVLFLPVMLALSPVTEVTGRESTLLIHGVQPNGECEWVTLFNHGREEVSLAGYTLSDGEGVVRFSKNASIAPKSSLNVFGGKPPAWAPGGESVRDGRGAIFTNFKLADSGDQVVLLSDGNPVDTFIYGDSPPQDGWSGEPFGTIPKNGYAIRQSALDTGTAKDWKILVPGRGEFDLGGRYEAYVSPFSFPESGGEQVASALASAKKEILVSVYMVTHKGIAFLIAEAAKRGVSVSVLAESTPAGGVPDAGVSVLKYLSDSGAEVKVISQNDGFRRFQFLHCKYAVVDSKYVVITSENWSHSSFNGNRGWGAVVESEDYAELMASIHRSDSSAGNPDIVPFEKAFPKAVASEPEPWSPSRLDCYEWYGAFVSPVLSPDNSLEAVNAFMSSSKTRLHSQQLSLQANWISSSDSPFQAMTQASKNGADAKLIVDNSFSRGEGLSMRESIDILKGMGVELRFSGNLENNGIVHNKGIVSDGSVWLGSVNWTRNSFSGNREVAVIIGSVCITDYFDSLFMSDWDNSKGKEDLVSVERSGEMVDGRTFSLRVSGVGDGTCVWDIAGEQYSDNPIMLSLPSGDHVCSVTVEKGGLTEKLDFVLRVVEVPSGNGQAVNVVFLPVAAAFLAALLFKFRGRIRG